MAGHWYLPTGEAYHFQENGKPTTLREARKVNAFPSVTTIIGILDKPALANWKLKQVTKVCYNDMRDWTRFSPDYAVYHDEIMGMAFEESTGARDRGSEIHNCIEMLVRDEPRDKFDSDIKEISRIALLEILRYCGLYTKDVIAEQTVVGDGYGGMIDLHNDEFVIDWKTKDIKDSDTGKKLAYPEMAMQLAAYSRALFASTPIPDHPSWDQLWLIDGSANYYNPRRCINVFIDRTIPGQVLIHEWKPEEIDLAWKKFKLLVEYWQLDKNYYPGAAFSQEIPD
jgi:hypothetical protein